MSNHLNIVRHRILKRFCSGSKNMHSFTTGTEQNLAADVAQRHLDELEISGYIKQIKNDSYAITQSGLSALDAYKASSVAMSKERGRRPDYIPSKWHVRKGADDHLQHQSAGMNAQLELATSHTAVSDRLAARLAQINGEKA